MTHSPRGGGGCGVLRSASVRPPRARHTRRSFIFIADAAAGTNHSTGWRTSRVGLVSGDPHPVGGPNFSGLLVEPNQMFGWSLVPFR